jgi:hypothetical protein
MAPSMKLVAAVLALALAPSIAGGAPRLGDEVVPYEYRLEVRPDLARETFLVEQAIRVRVTEPVATITLHAIELEIESMPRRRL